MIYEDKVEYDGQYVNEKRHGFGIYRWPDGKKYIGWWLQGK